MCTAIAHAAENLPVYAAADRRADIEKQPQEILALIFSGLNIKEIASVALTCKKFYKTVNACKLLQRAQRLYYAIMEATPYLLGYNQAQQVVALDNVFGPQSNCYKGLCTLSFTIKNDALFLEKQYAVTGSAIEVETLASAMMRPCSTSEWQKNASTSPQWILKIDYARAFQYSDGSKRPIQRKIFRLLIARSMYFEHAACSVMPPLMLQDVVNIARRHLLKLEKKSFPLEDISIKLMRAE